MTFNANRNIYNKDNEFLYIMSDVSSLCKLGQNSEYSNAYWFLLTNVDEENV